MPVLVLIIVRACLPVVVVCATPPVVMRACLPARSSSSIIFFFVKHARMHLCCHGVVCSLELVVNKKKKNEQRK